MKPKKRSEAAKAILPNLPRPTVNVDGDTSNWTPQDHRDKAQAESLRLVLELELRERPMYLDDKSKRFIIDLSMVRLETWKALNLQDIDERKVVQNVLGFIRQAHEAGWNIIPTELDFRDYEADPDDPY